MAAQQTESRNGRWFPRTSALLGSAVLCALIGGAVAYTIPAEERARRQDLLNKLPAEERAVVKAQFERFKALPEDQKNHWRQFHAELLADRSGLQGELDQYIEWLGSLSLPDREKVRQVSDPVQRAVKVVEIRKKQAEREQFGVIDLPRFGEPHVLSPVDFEAAISALVGYLQQNRPSWEHEMPKPDGRNDQPSRAARYLPTLGRHLALNKDANAQQAIDAALGAVTDVKTKNELDSTADPKKRRYRVYLLLVRTWGAYVSKVWPDPDTDEGRTELEAYFESLDIGDKDWLLNKPPEMFWNSLRFHYAWKKRIPIPSFPMLGVIHNAKWDGNWPMQISWEPHKFGGRRGPQGGRDGDRGRGRPGENRPGENPPRPPG